MGRTGSWGYVCVTAATLVSCGALVACTVETIERRVTPAQPATATDPSEPDPEANGAAPDEGTSGTSGGTSGTSGTNGTPARDAGTTSGGTSGSDSGASTSSSGSSGNASQFDSFQLRNLADINAYRATKNLAPIALDKQLSTFAMAGSVMLSQDHSPHHHFIIAGNDGTLWNAGFQGGAAENQGDPHGWTKLSSDPVMNEMKQIDAIQKAMFDEGPGTGEAHGHYMNMMNPSYHRVGVGLLMVGDSLYLTNDFSQ
jgi:uncharacterized protein YkwD